MHLPIFRKRMLRILRDVKAVENKVSVNTIALMVPEENESNRHQIICTSRRSNLHI